MPLKYIISLCIFVNGLLLALVPTESIEASTLQAPPKPIRATLSPIETHHGFSTPIAIRFTYKNISQSPVSFLIRGTALSGAIRDHMLEVYHSGSQLEYQGPVFKRLPPQKDEYIILAPGEARSIDLQLEKAFSFFKVGSYEIFHHPRADIQVSDIPLIIELTQARFANKVTPTFRTCDAVQSTNIDAALAVAEFYAVNTAGGMRNISENERSSSPRYREWFGTYSASRWNHVQKNISQIAAIANRTKLTFDCGCAEGGENTIAYVYPSLEYQIFLCPLFWQRGRSGVDSQAGTIIHEISHFQSSARTDDHAYGLTNSRNLARGNPNAAVNNADNYQFFSENPGGLSWNGPTNGGPAPNPTPEPEPEPEPEESFGFLSAIYGLLLDDTPAAEPITLAQGPFPTPEKNIEGLYSISIESDANEFYGRGRSFIFNQRNSNIDLSSSGSDRRVLFAINGVRQHDDSIPSSERWGFHLESKHGPLKRGVYAYASSDNDPFVNSILSVTREGTSGDASCNVRAGYFRIYDVQYTGGVLTRLVADFKQSCDLRQSALRGSIDFDSTREPLTFDSENVPIGSPSPANEPLQYRGTRVHIETESILGLKTSRIFDTRNQFIISTTSRYPRAGVRLFVNNGPERWTISMKEGNILADLKNQRPLSPGIYKLTSDNSDLDDISPYLTIHRNPEQGEPCDFRGEFRIFEIEQGGFFNHLYKLTADAYGKCANSGETIRASIRVDNNHSTRPYMQPEPITQPLTPSQAPLTSAGARIAIRVGLDSEIETADSSEQNITLNSYQVNQRVSLAIQSGTTSIVLTKAVDSNDLLHKGRFGTGVYTPASSGSDPRLIDLGEAQLRVTHDREILVSGCDFSTFSIHEIEYDDADQVVKLVADFESYRCSNGHEGRVTQGSIIFDHTLAPPSFPEIVQPIGPLRPSLPELTYSGGMVRMTRSSDSSYERLYTSEDANFTATTGANKDRFQVQVHLSASSSFQTISFVRSKLDFDPLANSPLTPGVYKISDGGSLNIGPSCAGDRIVRIFDIQFGENNRIDKLIADYEVNCNDFSDTGSIYIDRSLPDYNFPRPEPPSREPYPPLPAAPLNSIMSVVDRETNESYYFGYGTEFSNIEVSDLRGLRFIVKHKDAELHEYWSFQFRRSRLEINKDGAIPLSPGAYVSEGSDRLSKDGYLEVYNSSRVCKEGSFNIYELEYDSNAKLTKLVADFETNCNIKSGKLSGSIHYRG